MEQNRRSKRMNSDDRRLVAEWLGRGALGEIRAKVLLENDGDLLLKKLGKLGRRKPRALEVDAIVDTGAVMSLLPLDMVRALGIGVLGKVAVTLANDQRISLPHTGGVRLTVCGRDMITDFLVGPSGCEPLLGRIVMERLDLIADPARRTLTPRPESPDYPTLKLKTLAKELAAV